MQEPKRKTVRLPAYGYGAGAWYFITVCTKDCARILGQIVGAAGFSVWQRSYYEHVIRGPQDLAEIQRYIANNPLQWVLDGKA